MLRLTILGLLAIAAALPAQQPAHVCVQDAHHHPMQGVTLARFTEGTTVTIGNTSIGLADLLATTGPDGCATFLSTQAPNAMPQEIGISLAGFGSTTIAEPPAGATITITLHPDRILQTVTVTADRGLSGLSDPAASIATLSQPQLQQAPGLALDDRLHQVAGFQLFRRTSSWTANPTSQGVSLRGLGSTAASRTLVVSDQVPQNDPFGGWIHWNEIPALDIVAVNLLRGGAANLYGSSAIGGVIDIVPATLAPLIADKFIATGVTGGTPHLEQRDPTAPAIFDLAADASGATENSATGDLLLNAQTRHILALGAFSALATGGYVPTAPASRGLIDVPANVFSQSGRIELRTPASALGSSAFLRGNILNEARGNGTPLTTNATRLWRYAGGGDLFRSNTTAALRLYGSRESYRQSFSATAADRNSEKLSRLQRVPTDEFGFTLQATREVSTQLSAALGLDLRDIRATDDETPVTNTLPGTTTSTNARQRETGGYADAIWTPAFLDHSLSLSGSIRADSFRTFDALQTTSNTTTITQLPELDELFASPRLGLAISPSAHGHTVFPTLTATAFRAFRGPTMNELYRTGQIAQQTTLANASLLAERATGFEFGTYLFVPHIASLRPTYFWTEVNRPISAVLLAQTGAVQTLQRQNLGQIRSRGLMLEVTSMPFHAFTATASYQLAFATVTAFNSTSPAQANLTGNQIPQVPRQAVTATANYDAPRIAAFHAIASYTGQQFDDAANQFILHPYARLDLSADRTLPHGLTVFASVQNLLNRSIDAGRTPLLTLAAPRLVQAGLRYNLTR